MKYLGYCPHCGSKIMEVKNLNFFDDFSVKCWKCVRIILIIEVKFKVVETVKIPNQNNSINKTRDNE